MELWKTHYFVPKSIFLLICSLLLLFQIRSLPSKQDGFWYENRTPKQDSIFIEAFFDPVCPDSRDAWPPLKQALQYYGSRVSLLIHPFALPYHDNSFLTSRALHVVNKLNASATYTLLESFLAHQEEFYNKATFDITRASAVDKVATFSTNAIGKSNYDVIKAGFSDYRTDQSTRVSFKYGCVKGVYGTPFFFVNGFPLPDAGSALDYKEWRSVLDPLNHQQDSRRNYLLRFFL